MHTGAVVITHQEVPMSENPVEYPVTQQSGGEIHFDPPRDPRPILSDDVAASSVRPTERPDLFTPVTEGGLTMYDHLPPAEAAYAAWTNPGPYPDWHMKVRRQVHLMAPLLARALDRWEAIRNA